VADERFAPSEGDWSGDSPTQASPPREERPSPSLAPVDLFIRPSRFFRHHARQAVPVLTWVAAYTFGVAGMIDQIDERALRSKLGGSAQLWSSVADDWAVYWALCLVGGAVSGALYYLVGGWWYRKRLEFSGAVDPDAGLARRVYVYAAQVYTLPLLAYSLWETVRYSSPRTAFEGDDPWAILVIGFVFWSVLVSYRGVRELFAVRPWPARTWFLIMPGGIYSLAVVAMIGVLLLGSSLFDQAPSIEQPSSIERPAFSMRYPSNWDAVVDERRQRFRVEPFLDDATVQLFVYSFPLDVLDASMETLEALSGKFDVLEMQAIDRWGEYDGKGFDLVLEMDGDVYRATTFSFSAGRVGFEIIEICETEAAGRLEPGFALVRESFVFRPQAVAASR
jgi:hypothetical protein